MKRKSGLRAGLDRREFLTRAGAGAMLVALTPRQRAEAAALAAEPEPSGRIDWKKAPCRFCGTGCGVKVGIRDGRAVAVKGDRAGPANRGLLCVKGYHLPAVLYGEDRLTRPMYRKSGAAAASPISWNDALDLIAEKFSTTLKELGPSGVAVYGSGQWTIHDGYTALKWVKGGMRSNNLEANARLCMSSAVSGFLTSFGSDEPMGCYDDFEAGDDFVLWGCNMAEMHPVLFSRMLETRRRKPGTHIIDLCTRSTPTSEYADRSILFNPGTDLALANGILHLLFDLQGVDEAFIRDHVVFKRGIEDVKQIGYGAFGKDADRYTFADVPRPSSLEEFKALIAEYTPAKTAEITGVPEATIRELASVYANAKRGTVSLWVMGVNQHVRGTWMNNLLNNLHLLTGKICRPGNNPFSLTGQPSACGTVREVGTLANRLPADMVVTNPEHRAQAERIWKVPAGTIPEKPGHHTMDMFRAFQRGEIRTMWIQTTNPWVTLPNLKRYDRRPGDGKFLVVSDVYPTPTTAVADLVLPAALWIEREGVFGNSERRTQQWDKLLDPPGEAKEDAWQMIEVARRMGMGHLFPWPEATWHAALYEEYRSFGVGIGKDLAPYEALRKAPGLQWPYVKGREVKYRYASKYDPYAKAPKGGVDFYKAKADGHKASVWFRPYHPPAEVPDQEFPFWLATGRVLEHWHSGSMTRRIKQLHQSVPESYAELHPDDAKALGVADGDQVKVASRRGELVLPARVEGRGQPPKGSVFIPFFDEGHLVNLVTLDAMDNISKQPDYKKCAVRVTKA